MLDPWIAATPPILLLLYSVSLLPLPLWHVVRNAAIYPKETEPQYTNPSDRQHRPRSAVPQLCPFDEHNHKHRFGAGRDDIWRSHHNTTPPAQGSYGRWSSLERLVVAVTSCILKGLCQAVKCDDNKRKVELKENGWVLSLP